MRVKLKHVTVPMFFLYPSCYSYSPSSSQWSVSGTANFLFAHSWRSIILSSSSSTLE